MTVAEALDDLERRLAVVEDALDAGQAPELPDFTPRALEDQPTQADLDRFAAAMQRLDACQARLREARTRLLEEHAGLGARRRAAAAYAGDA